tara:strand:- start:59817 stop:60731 length:915 start_codon:yes stop_codon:yes gene_type:complete
MSILNTGRSVKKEISSLKKLHTQQNEELKLLIAKGLIKPLLGKTIQSLREVEFKVFSQFGDDGIIQWLVNNLDIKNNVFIEFGVEDYEESNTRFLMINDNWSGLVMDASDKNVARIKNSDYHWRHDLQAKSTFVTKENINQLITEANLPSEIGLLHVDLDGNDYWVWDAIDSVDPTIFIGEYNSVFGETRPITIPYNPSFIRTEAHYSNLYFGASIKALHHLAAKKGYAFVGCNSAGNNAYFVKEEKLNDVVKEVSLESGFVCSKFRESRNQQGELTYLSGGDRLAALKGLPVINVETGKTETL